MLGCKGLKCRPSMNILFFMFKSYRKQTTILDLQRIITIELGSLQCGTTLMSNILLWKSYTNCVAFNCASVTFSRFLVLYIAKCTVLVRNVLSKQLHKLTLFIFVGLWTFRSCEVRLPPSFKVRPWSKAGSPPPMSVLCHGWKYWGKYSRPTNLFQKWLHILEWIIAIYFQVLIGFV